MNSDISQRVTEVTSGLSRLSKEGFDVVDLAQIWAKIPSADFNSPVFFDKAMESIRAVSQLVDRQFPEISSELKTAKKLRLMAGLLEIKASQIENL